MAEKTKAMLLEEIKELKKELDNLERYKQYEECADQTKALYDSYVKSGFTEEQAFKLTLKMVEAAGIMNRKFGV